MHRHLTSIAIALLLAGAGVTSLQAQQPQQPQQPAPPMSFFISSVGVGQGGNLGGLAGADKHCQQLAAAAGQGSRMWRAYLSTTAAGATPNVNARDRIGRGPWFNAKGQLIASNIDDLHQDRNNIRKPSALTEKGAEVNGVGNTPNQHDILTGSDSTGRALPGAAQITTCNNWTSSDDTSRTIVGHHDRLGGASASWNATHASAGCSQESLVKTGGAGLLYCFAAD